MSSASIIAVPSLKNSSPRPAGAGRFRLRDGGGGSFLQIGQPLDSGVEVGNGPVPIGKIHGRQRRREAIQRRHFLVARGVEDGIYRRSVVQQVASRR